MIRSSHRKPNLLRAWKQVRPRIRGAKRIVLFLDFDGTLSAHRTRPQDASISPAMHRALLVLALRPDIKIHVISGRRCADVIARVPISDIQCFGLHGWERKPASPPRPKARHRMLKLQQALESALPHRRDFWIEDKQFTIALHFRTVSRQRLHALHLAVRKILVTFGQGIWVLENQREWELLPPEIRGKGNAVQTLFRRDRACAGTLAVLIGDDASDESAFRALRGGITVRVGPACPTAARFRLAGPSQVLKFLQALAKERP
jgi:trehalose-phosphatase